MTLAERIRSQRAPSASGMRDAYVAAVGTVATFAPPIPHVSEWVRLAQAGRLPAKELSR